MREKGSLWVQLDSTAIGFISMFHLSNLAET